MVYYIQEEDCSKSTVNHYTRLIELSSDNPRHYNIRGCAYYKQGNLKEAVLDFTRAIELENTQPLYYKNRAVVYYQLCQYENATRDYTKAISLENLDQEVSINSESAKVFLGRADALRLQGNLDAAIRDYEKAHYIISHLNSDSKDNGLLVYCDEVKEYIGKKEHNKKLIEDSTQLIRLNSNELDYYYIRGNTYFEQKNFKHAMKDYTRIIESGINHPKLCYAYYKRVICYCHLYYAKVDQDLIKALELLNNDYINYSLRGCIYFELEEYEKALADLGQALDINPKDVNAYRCMGEIYQKQRKIEQAINQFSKAIQYDGKFAEDYYYRAKCYHMLDRIDQAIEDYTRAIELEDGCLEYYKYRGYAYWKLEKSKEAIADFTHLINNNYQYANYDEDENIIKEDKEKKKQINAYLKNLNNEELAKIYFCRGSSYVRLGISDQAKEDYCRAIEICSHYLQPYYARAYEIYEREKEYDKAIDDYTTIIEFKDSTDKTGRILALERRAFIYKQLKQYDKAIEDFTELIVLDKENINYYILRADLYMKVEDYDRAIDDYSFVINVDSQCAGAFLARGDAYRKKNNLDAGINDYETVRKIQVCNSR